MGEIYCGLESGHKGACILHVATSEASQCSRSYWYCLKTCPWLIQLLPDTPLLWTEMSGSQLFRSRCHTVNKDNSGMLWFKHYSVTMARFNEVISCLFVLRGTSGRKSGGPSLQDNRLLTG